MSTTPEKSLTLREKLAQRLTEGERTVFLREDFADLGGYDQVGRALRQLVQAGSLIKMGYGLYVRMEPSLYDGRPVIRKGISQLAREALGRLGVTVVPTRAVLAYNSGQSTQVPTGRQIGVRSRIRRKLKYYTAPLSYEYARSISR
jgi:hypothetical protein